MNSVPSAEADSLTLLILPSTYVLGYLSAAAARLQSCAWTYEQ